MERKKYRNSLTDQYSEKSILGNLENLQEGNRNVAL